MQTACLMPRAPPEWATMLPLRVFQGVFLLVLFLVASPPSRCNATVIGSTSSIATGTGGVTTTSTKTIRTGMVGADSSVVPRKVVPEYECGVGDAGKLNGLKTAMLSHADCTRNNCVGGVAMVDGANNRVSSVASRGSASDASVFALKDVPENVSSVAKSSPCSDVVPDDATVTFTAPNPYYGMELTATTNIPNTETYTTLALLDTRRECDTMTEGCQIWNGCFLYFSIGGNRLPPPGSYQLCVYISGCGNAYRRWGDSTLEVKVFVPTPLYLFNGVVPTVKLLDGDTGETASDAGALSIYLVLCGSYGCPLIGTMDRVLLVNYYVCDEKSYNDRVKLPTDTFDVKPGNYALCVESRSGDATPAAFQVRVVQETFSMEVVRSSEGSVKVQVAGGDIGNRKDKYAVCVMERSAPCAAVTLENKCTWSEDQNSLTVDVDLNGVAAGNVTLCLVARKEAYNGHTYLSVMAEERYEVAISPSESPTTSGDESSNTSGDSSSSDVEIKRARIWIPILIAILGALLLCGAIGAICYLRRRKKQLKTAMFSVE